MRYVLEYVRKHPQQGRYFFNRHMGRGLWSDTTADVPRYWTKQGAEDAMLLLPKGDRQHLKVSHVGIFG